MSQKIENVVEITASSLDEHKIIEDEIKSLPKKVREQIKNAKRNFLNIRYELKYPYNKTIYVPDIMSMSISTTTIIIVSEKGEFICNIKKNDLYEIQICKKS